MNPAIPEGIIRNASISIYGYMMIGIGIVVAFLLLVAISKNLVNMAWSFNIGLSLKFTKKYRYGDIFEYDKKEWYLDALNTYDIKFKEVIERTQKEITLSNKQLIIPYSLFIKKRMWCGHFGM